AGAPAETGVAGVAAALSPAPVEAVALAVGFAPFLGASSALRAASASSSRCGSGGPASLLASSFKAAGTVPSGAIRGAPGFMLSTVRHSAGRSPTDSGGFFGAGFAPGTGARGTTGSRGAAASALRSILYQFANSVPQPSSAAAGFWFSQPSAPGG